MLVSAGYDVDWAGDGVKAVESAAAFRYDLILMDIELPLIDGMEATRRIRAAEGEAAHSPVPVVGLTAHAVESVQEAALAAGMDNYATKPIQKAQLLEVCSRWVNPRPVLLIADDSPDIHVLLTNYLGRDYRLVFAFNGREAVAAFRRQRFSLVILDIGLPLMNGYEAARAIRSARGGDVVPIVAVTGYDGHEGSAGIAGGRLQRARLEGSRQSARAGDPPPRRACVSPPGASLGPRNAGPASVQQPAGTGPVAVLPSARRHGRPGQAAAGAARLRWPRGTGRRAEDNGAVRWS